MNYKKLLNRAKENVGWAYELEGEVLGEVVGFSGNGVMVLPLCWNDKKERQDSIVFAAAMLQANGANAYALRVEAWTSCNDNSQPSKSSEQREKTLVAAVHNSTSVTSTADVIRHKDTSVTRGDVIDARDVAEISGLLTSLLTMHVPLEIMMQAMTECSGEDK